MSSNRRPVELVRRPNGGADSALRQLGASRTLADTFGPAVYQLPDDGAPMSAIACGRCQTVRVILSIPRRSLLTYACPCGARIYLAPPLEVVAAGNRPA